jgi:hypothetical protein
MNLLRRNSSSQNSPPFLWPKKRKRSIFFMALAARNWSKAEHPIYCQIFWDALSGKDRHDHNEYTDEAAAKQAFENTTEQ